MSYPAGVAMCEFNGNLGCKCGYGVKCTLVVDLLILVQSYTRNINPSVSLFMECFKFFSVFAVSFNMQCQEREQQNEIFVIKTF